MAPPTRTRSSRTHSHLADQAWCSGELEPWKRTAIRIMISTLSESLIQRGGGFESRQPQCHPAAPCCQAVPVRALLNQAISSTSTVALRVAVTVARGSCGRIAGTGSLSPRVRSLRPCGAQLPAQVARVPVASGSRAEARGERALPSRVTVLPQAGCPSRERPPAKRSQPRCGEDAGSSRL